METGDRAEHHRPRCLRVNGKCTGTQEHTNKVPEGGTPSHRPQGQASPRSALCPVAGKREGNEVAASREDSPQSTAIGATLAFVTSQEGDG